MKCKICKTESKPLFKTTVLSKYEVEYFKCPACDFIQTENPSWLNEAYSNAITDLDVGLVGRNLAYSEEVKELITENFNPGGKFLDYAGGYGLFVRLMRDMGLNFFRQDKYCDNLFAKNFDIEDIPKKCKFEALTAFEVFEHLDSPISDFEKMLSLSDSIIFSTELQPKKINTVDDWWYFVPETGQHISLFAKKTLEFIAKKYKLNLYSNGSLHLLTSKKFKKNPLPKREVAVSPIKSQTWIDYEIAKKSIANRPSVEKELPKLPEKKLTDILLERLALVGSKQEVSEDELSAVRVKFSELKREIDQLQPELESKKSELNVASTQLNQVNRELATIHSSRTWKIACILQNLLSKTFPIGTRRRRAATKMFRLLKKIIKAPAKIKEKILEVAGRVKMVFFRWKPKKKRRINTDSKKIVYIGHSYHIKTQSTGFLIDYLEKFYDVEFIADESWKGEGDEYPDLSHIDESYLAVIFFQNLPNDLNVIKNIKNENILFFPMYDACSTWGYDNWRKLRDLKIMNFSSTLHKKLVKWGFESAVVQYFPDPQEFIKGKKDEAFFWQRLTFININTVSSILGSEKIKLHIHRAIDPVQEYVPPTKEQEKQFQITYSDWFKEREEMWDLIKEKAIYVAPREYEGIGLSFLEAMAMGKAIIAVNNPTMNEYIVHNKTGYLFDLENPQKINLSNLEQVQKETYRYMTEGYKKWQQQKHQIIEFIER